MQAIPESPVCAYCKLPETLTREHLWPAALHRRLIEVNKQEDSIFWLARVQKDLPNEPLIRDVCAHCNNVVLSALDAYICRLFDSALVRIPLRHERVQFQYDYHLLKRWLLKMSFNSARIHNSPDLPALEALLPYILGSDDSIGRSVQLFVQLSYPEEVPEEEVDSDVPSQQPVLFEPTLNRVGHMFFRVHGVGKKLLRAIHLRSFSFYLAFFRPGERRAVLDDFARVFTERMLGALLLRPSQPRVVLACEGMGAWESFKGSRSNRFVFNDDV